MPCWPSADRLDPALYGPSVAPHISKYQDGRGKPASGPLDGSGRRSIYHGGAAQFHHSDVPRLRLSAAHLHHRRARRFHRAVAGADDDEQRIGGRARRERGRRTVPSSGESSEAGMQRMYLRGALRASPRSGNRAKRSPSSPSSLRRRPAWTELARCSSTPRSSSMSNSYSRRQMLCRAANGFGGVGAAAHAGREGAAPPRARRTSRPKPRRVIFLFMDGGPSQVDTFDPKPRLTRENGQTLPFRPPDHGVQHQRQDLRLALPVQAIRPERRLGQRSVPARGRVRGRPGDHPLDGRRPFRTHRRQLLHALRLRLAGPAEHGRVGQLWAGQRSARICPASSCSTAA